MGPIKALTKSSRLYSRAEVLGGPSPVPACRGLYAWFFKNIPGDVPSEGCITKDGLTLLYVGISPKKLIPGQSAPRFRDDVAHPFRLIAAQGSD
jgi:hypothetical protein